MYAWLDSKCVQIGWIEIVFDSKVCPVYCFKEPWFKYFSHLSSEMHRAIKLFLVGRMGRGKTSLLQRLCSQLDLKTGHTEEPNEGIHIEDFSYTPPVRTGSIFSKSRQPPKEPVTFHVWDFAGQVHIPPSIYTHPLSRRKLHTPLKEDNLTRPFSSPHTPFPSLHPTGSIPLNSPLLLLSTLSLSCPVPAHGWRRRG